MDKLPEADKSRFAFINIRGRRLDQFFDEAMRLIPTLGLAGADAKQARKEVNFAHRDAFRNGAVDFDKADTGSYWSYGHDAPFTHVFEKMLKSLPEGDPKRELVQNQLDYVFAHKYAPHGHVEELDCEKSLELMAIGKESRHVVSMTKASESSQNPSYETLQVTADGPNKDKFAYRDGDKYYLEGTGAELTGNDIQNLKSTRVDDVTFRRAEGNEQPRDDFKYDWNGNRMVEVDQIDTGWWGHCDIKATMETILADMEKSGGVHEFRSDTGDTTQFSKADQLEALAALLNFGDAYASFRGGRDVQFGETGFAGARYDDRPSKMTIKTNRGSVPVSIKLKTLSGKNDYSANVELAKVFSDKLVADDKKSFKDNPDILRTEQGDINYIDASDRKITGTVEGWTFNSSGNPTKGTASFTIDPSATDGEKVLIGEELTNINNRTTQRTYYDPKTGELSQVSAEFKKQSDGTFKAEEGTSRNLGKMSGVEMGREMKGGDDEMAKLQMLETAIRTGEKIAADSDAAMQVWNGEVHRISMKTEWRSDDGEWERVSIRTDATYGSGKTGEFLNRLDDEGKVIESVEIKPAVDFYWQDRPRIAPLISERGNWYVNRAMYDRGVVDVSDNAGIQASIGALTDLNDLIYLGLKAKDSKPLYTIVHDGQRLVYENKAAWQADVDKLKGGTTDPGGGGGGTTGPVKVSSKPDLAIPDNDPAGISDKIAVDADGKVKDIKIDIDLKHTYVGDLNVSVVAPDGTEVTLHKRGGRGRDDIAGTYGDDLKSHDRLDALKGLDAKGDWTLKVVDMAGRDVGKLVEWGLQVDVE
jgi:subtilisin-like proprotein convertase family protein